MVFVENKNDISKKIRNSNSFEDLEKLRLYYLGRKGIIPEALKGLAKLSIEEKKSKGQEINIIKKFVEEKLKDQKSIIEKSEIEKKINKEIIDVTLPPNIKTVGKIHPISQTIFNIIEIFGNLNYSVETGPDIETDFNNFTAFLIQDIFLNISVAGSSISEWVKWYGSDVNKSLKFILNENYLKASVWMQGEAEDLKSSKDYFDNFRSLKDIMFKDLQNQFALSNFQRAGLAGDVASLGSLGAFRQGLTQSQLQADQDLARTGAYEGMQRLQQFGTGLGQLSGFGTPATPLPASPSPFSTALSTALGIGGLFGKFRN